MCGVSARSALATLYLASGLSVLAPAALLVASCAWCSISCLVGALNRYSTLKLLWCAQCGGQTAGQGRSGGMPGGTHVMSALSPICMAHWAVMQHGQQQDSPMSSSRLLVMPECLATAWRWMMVEHRGRHREQQQANRKLWPIAWSVMPYWMQGQQ